jgi:hypothetical protein
MPERPKQLICPTRQEDSAGGAKDQGAQDRSVGINLSARASFDPCTQMDAIPYVEQVAPGPL